MKPEWVKQVTQLSGRAAMVAWGTSLHPAIGFATFVSICVYGQYISRADAKAASAELSRSTELQQLHEGLQAQQRILQAISSEIQSQRAVRMQQPQQRMI